MAPPFAFRIDELRQHREVRSRRRDRVWLPPRPEGSSVISQIGPWLRNMDTLTTNGQPMAAQVYENDLPENFPVYKTFSMYHSRDAFYIVDYDASENMVGIGTQDDAAAAEADDSDSSSSGSSSLTSGEPFMDWSELSFSLRGRGWSDYTSFATYGGEEDHLYAQNPHQPWVPKLLPERYHAEHFTNAPPHQCGMVGHLPLLLGLVAYSVAPEHVTRTMQYCIAGQQWRMHSGPRRAGWLDKRGLVIRVHLLPGTNRETLEDFELGVMGKAFP